MLKRNRRIRARKRAFTLLEVIIVIVIIGLLAAVVLPNFFGVAETQKVKLTTALIESGINGAINAFRANMGRFPSELKELYEKPEGEAESRNWTKLIDDPAKLRDAFGNELVYKAPGDVNTGGYDLSSPGPDKTPGTDDDITNWRRN